MDYKFVVTSSDPGNASQNTRQLVRQRASRAAARTRRREARLTGVNQLQMPPWLEADLARASAQSVDPLFIQPTPSITRTLSPSPPRSLLPIRELLEFSKYDMSKTLLSHDELSPILAEPLRIQKILSLMHEQFFLGLGERHEANQCINDAVHCLWAYLQQFLLPESLSASKNKHVKCYVRALNSIRSALDEGSTLDGVDVCPLNHPIMAGFCMPAGLFMFWKTSDHGALLPNLTKIFSLHNVLLWYGNTLFERR
ncbi:hypothetical protein DM02DRAFT_635459 [Periconia macrospinosa]|uniref:Uncharacterized protein n=1 Tax=Periconia macrospinosa TaxID=97972 RepID=A0A2V1D3W4_9PLEO|nr:hypothetical protein DM02DRAFT_635459 [Periconia macrospinosa]